MKTFRILGLLVLSAIGLSSCDWLFGHEEPEYDYIVYNLALGFRDASGNDLVKGIGLKDWQPGASMENAQWGSVDDDLYKLDIIVSEPCHDWSNDTYDTPSQPGIGSVDVKRPNWNIDHYDKDYYLQNRFTLPVNACPEEKKLTYKLICPYVFGDDEVHELITYWDIPKEKTTSHEYFAQCVRIEFKGYEIIPNKCNDEDRGYRVVIRLDSVQKKIDK